MFENQLLFLGGLAGPAATTAPGFGDELDFFFLKNTAKGPVLRVPIGGAGAVPRPVATTVPDIEGECAGAAATIVPDGGGCGGAGAAPGPAATTVPDGGGDDDDDGGGGGAGAAPGPAATTVPDIEGECAGAGAAAAAAAAAFVLDTAFTVFDGSMLAFIRRMSDSFFALFILYSLYVFFVLFPRYLTPLMPFFPRYTVPAAPLFMRNFAPFFSPHNTGITLLSSALSLLFFSLYND